MTGPLIEKLKIPPSRFRIDSPDSPFFLAGFETIEAATNEDAIRIRGLEKAILMGSPLLDKQRAEWLKNELQVGIDGGTLGPNLGSALYYREQRIRLTGHLLRCLTRQTQAIATFTLIPKAWKFTPAQLVTLEPKKLLEQLRTQLRRSGSEAAEGFLFAALHGEFEPNAGHFVLHVHGICTGQMTGVIDRLRDTAAYKTHQHVKRPVRIATISPSKPSFKAELAKAVSYLTKSYWPSRAIGPFGQGGKVKRVRSSRRIPEPLHSTLIVWLSSFQLNDIILLIKLHIKNQKLRLR